MSIDAGGEARGSGFLVSADGFILTASHVVRDGNIYHTAIDVLLSTGEHLPAEAATPLTPENVGEDYALLKVSTSRPLPFLILGNTSEVEIGGEATIIGFPFSAISAQGGSISTKFCLSANFSAVANESHPVSGAQITRGKRVPFNKDIHVDVIYFQGPSVKGISGSPVISRETGHVVGIVSTKLTGISQGLSEIRSQIPAENGQHFDVGDIPFVRTIREIIDTMDRQLANGLGSAVGVEQAAKELDHAKRQTPRH